MPWIGCDLRLVEDEACVPSQGRRVGVSAVFLTRLSVAKQQIELCRDAAIDDAMLMRREYQPVGITAHQ